MKNVSNTALLCLGPVFILGADFIASRFSSTSKATATKLQLLFMNHVYGTRFYNTNLKLFPKDR